MPYDKIDRLYDALVKDGATEDSREEFRGKMLARGKEGYQNRFELWKYLRSEGASTSPTYEEFARRLGLHAAAPKPRQKPATERAAASAPEIREEYSYAIPTFQDTIGKGMIEVTSAQMAADKKAEGQRQEEASKPQPVANQPLTEEKRQEMIDQVQQMLYQAQASAQRSDNRVRFKMANVGLKSPRTNLGFKDGGMKLGQNPNVVEGEAKFNLKTGKMERTYITESGNEYGSRAEADLEQNAIDAEARQPLGLNMSKGQVSAAQKPASDAVAALWDEATKKYAADRDKNAEEVYGGNPWLNAGREMRAVNAGLTAHKDEVSRLTHFDLKKMADDAWGRVGEQMTASCYQQLKEQYPTAPVRQLQMSAEMMARSLSDDAVYKYAVAKNTPKSTLDFFKKTVIDTNLLTSIKKGLARADAGTTGDMGAYEQAMSDYGKNHRLAQVGGTVVGMMFDPTTYISGGVGSLVGKGALNIGGRILAKNAATNVGARLFGNKLAGRVVAGVAGGAGNLGTYEGIKEAESQWVHGGHINPETGENDGFSAGEVLKSSLHGVVMGSATGTMSPLLGNVADKWVKATSNAYGKVGVRAGELVTSTIAEGTIFSVPEWIENSKLDDDNPNKRSAWDVWNDNMAMMMGFKGKHLLQSAPRVIAGLRPIEHPKTMQERNHNRMSFVELLGKQMDASPRDIAFTNEEREELKRYGYGDLAALFTRTPKQQPKPKAKPTTTDEKVMNFDIPEADVEDLGKQAREQWLKQHPEFDGYEVMEHLVQDKKVSQSARAKAYYILTGRQLPMGTVTGYTTEKDEHGNIFVKSVTADGEVVTSRRFTDEASAMMEQDKIVRQAELNGVDVGERYSEAKANYKVFAAAVEAVVPGADPATVMRNYKAAKDGDKDAIANYGQMFDAIDKFIALNKGMADAERPEAIRAAIKEETGVDVDAAIKKEPSKRTESEKEAVEDYLKRLYSEQDQDAEQPMSDYEAGAAAIYDHSRLLLGKVEQGDAEAKDDMSAIIVRLKEAYRLFEEAFGTDAEMREAEMQDDPWALLNNPELTEDQRGAVLYYINAKAAMDGIQDASNDAMENKRRKAAAKVELRTHKDNGVVQPATMKLNNKPVYIVKGNVVPLPDGSGIDVRNSDKSIVVCDAKTGVYKFTSPDQIFNIGEAIDPQAELDEAYAKIQAEHDAMMQGAGLADIPGEPDGPEAGAQGKPTEEQVRNYAKSVFDEAMQGQGDTALPQEQFEQLQQHNQQMLEQEQQRKEEEANRVPTALERVPVNKETGEPMFEKADKETALDALNELTDGNEANTTAIVNAQVEQAQKAVDALKKKQPTKKDVALKGSPMAMIKAQQEADANYNAAMEQYNAQVAEAEETLKAWSRIYSLMNERKRAERERQQAEQRAKDEAAYAAAVAQEQAEYEARKRAEEERRKAGYGNVMPGIVNKWVGAQKQVGLADEYVAADGTHIKGHYVLYEDGAASPSHDPRTWQATEGLPMDENGNSPNDRDYQGDMDARRVTEEIAAGYDQRALQDPVVVSQDGVVLSGNGRTMAGILAAQNGTDTAYIDYLRNHGAKFGFSEEQVGAMAHPRVAFVPDEALPYTAKTFAMFNARTTKAQNRTELSIKLGKTVPDDVFLSVAKSLRGYDSLADFYADNDAALSAVYGLARAGVISNMQLAEMIDGARGNERISTIGKEFLENILVGKAFSAEPDVVRMLTEIPSMRQSVVTALAAIADNVTLKGGYSLQDQLTDAVKLCFTARTNGKLKYGDKVSPYAGVGQLFAHADEMQTVADYNNVTMLMLADMLNDQRTGLLRATMELYNDEARRAASGVQDMFADGGIRTREEILSDIINYVKKNYGNKKEISQRRAEAAERRKQDGTAEDGNAGESGQEGGAADAVAAEQNGANTEPAKPQGKQSNADDPLGEIADVDSYVEQENRKGNPIEQADVQEGNDALGEIADTKNEAAVNSFDEFVADSGDEVVPNGVKRSSVVKFAERVLGKYPSYTKDYDLYNAKRTDVEIPANKLFQSERNWFNEKNGDVVAVNDLQNKVSYELIGHKDAQGHLKSVSVIKYYDFDNNGNDALGEIVGEGENSDTHEPKFKKGSVYQAVPSEDEIIPRENVVRVGAYNKELGKYHVMFAQDMEDLKGGLLMGDGELTEEELEKVLKGLKFIGFHEHPIDSDAKQHKAEGVTPVSAQDVAMRDALVDVLNDEVGIDTSLSDEVGQRVMDAEEDKIRAQKRALETASVSSDEAHQPTVVSSADGAKVINNLRKLKNDFENLSNSPKFFIGTVAKALDAKRDGSNSEYATFETVNGRIVTIRLADHNAKVSNFDRRGEFEGISIVVSPKQNEGVIDDGKAHIVEFFYNAIKLRRAEGKPLVEIIKSIEQALYSGEYKDRAGLAKRQEVNPREGIKLHRGVDESGIRFFRTSDGQAYGFTLGGRIYIDPRIAKPDTPIHEYTHLWAEALRKANPEEWANVVRLMKGTGIWDEVKSRYPELKTDDEIAEEVLAHFSGKRGAERLRQAQSEAMEQKGLDEKAAALDAISRVKQALKKFWKGVADFFHIHFTTAEEVADKVLADMLHGVDPRKVGGVSEKMKMQFVGEKGAAALDKAAEATTRLDNLAVAREMEQAGKDAKAVKLATGWERGKDGKWRYEIEDMKAFDVYGNLRYAENHPKYKRYLELAEKSLAYAFDEVDEDLTDAEKREFEELSERFYDYAGRKLDNINTLDAYVNAPELFEAYPQLKHVRVRFEDTNGHEKASYHVVSDVLSLDDTEDVGEIVVNTGKMFEFTHNDEYKSVFLHEIQHAIQSIEGFADGGSASSANGLVRDIRNALGVPVSMKVSASMLKDYINEYADTGELAKLSDIAEKYGFKSLDAMAESLNPYTYYNRLAGEVEARNVQARMGMSLEERRASLAADTEDVAREDQIVLMDGLGVSEMGSRDVRKRDAFTLAFDRDKLGGNKKAIYDVFSENINRSTLAISRNDGSSLELELVKGKWEDAGARHTLHSHVDIDGKGIKGMVTFEEILRIDDIVANGERKAGNKENTIAYVTNLDGVRLTVITAKHGKKEVFQNFYSNRKSLPAESVHTRPEMDGTQTIDRLSAANVVEDINLAKKPEENLSEDTNLYRPLKENDPKAKELEALGDDELDTTEDKAQRVSELAERLNTPVRIVRTDEEVAALPSARQRKAKGWYDPMTGEVTIVVPNNANLADVENTCMHEVVGHDGLRVLFPEEEQLNNALDELYRVSVPSIQQTIDRKAQQMYAAEVDRLREKKRKEHEAKGEDANASYYTDMAEAHAEASKSKEQFRRDATEEYGADLAGRIGENGFEKMSAEELTFWGKLKAMLEKALQKLLAGFGIPGKRKWSDKEWAFVLHEAYKRKKNGGKPSVADVADTVVMREKTGFGETKFRDGDMGLDETITQMKVAASQANADKWQAKQEAMKAIGTNLDDLGRAMSIQRAFDRDTVKRVTDLARVLMAGGYLNAMNQQEVIRLLAAVKNSTGREDIAPYVQKVMDIMVDNQLRNAEAMLHALVSVKGSKVDARGVEVQGQLDADGAHLMNTFKKTRGLSIEDIERLQDDASERCGSEDAAVANDASVEFYGLLMAHEYASRITASKAEEIELRNELKKGDVPEGQSRKEFVASIEDAIRQNKIERAQAYFDIVSRVRGSLGESIANAAAFREAEKQRVREIHHNANSDMQGRPFNEHRKGQGIGERLSNFLGNTLFAPLATFNEMLRLFGGKSAGGEGYLYNRFSRGWVEARQKEIRGVRDKFAKLDAKAHELFGRNAKTWGDLLRYAESLPKAEVAFFNGGEKEKFKLGQGNLMYIYMVNKMLDGRMKLRGMGITEADVEAIKSRLDPRLVELADWLQEEFLVSTRNEYNKTHKRVFGASMAAIEDYFPLRILSNAREDKEEEIDRNDYGDAISTTTGAIKKRTRNALALDLLNANALGVMLDHISTMEHWNAYAEFNRDLNTLRTYRRFRNQVQNMTTIYGGGKQLWQKFNDLCQMASGKYSPRTKAFDKGALAFAQGVSAAKVSFRIYTALKQFASLPAYLPYVSAVNLAASMARPKKAFDWCLANLPIFEERFKSRVAGDPRLVKSALNAMDWRQNLATKAVRAGMFPNAFIDAITVAIGAHATYKTRLGKYVRDGHSEAEAERRAIQDAEVAYNETQQSSEGAFTSTMQVDRTWLSVMFSLFRNASMSYERQLVGAVRDLSHILRKGGKAEMREFVSKQLVRDGVEETEAWRTAKRKVNRQLTKDAIAVATFGYILQLAWNLSGYLPYLLFGDDDDEKSKMMGDVWTHTLGGWAEGFAGGDVISLGIGMLASGEFSDWKLKKEMPITSDLFNVIDEISRGNNYEAITGMVNLIVQSGIGVNPQSITDTAVAIMDACGNDAQLAHEATLFIARVLQVPQSQTKKMYFDEVGLSGDELSEYTPAKLAERYAKYQLKRGRLFTPWAWGDEYAIAKDKTAATSIIKEKTLRLDDKQKESDFAKYEQTYKDVAKRFSYASKAAKTDYVKAAVDFAVLSDDKESLETYYLFKDMDKGLDEIVKLYLGSESPEEANLCKTAVAEYKSSMVGVLRAGDEHQRASALKELGEVMTDFYDKYLKIHYKK